MRLLDGIGGSRGGISVDEGKESWALMTQCWVSVADESNHRTRGTGRDGR